jgi:hypothetical protein
MEYDLCLVWGFLGDAEEGSRVVGLLAKEFGMPSEVGGLEGHSALHNVVFMEGAQCEDL